MPKQKPSTIKLQVFKGREATLNKTIFQALAMKGPQTIYDMHRDIRTQRELNQTRYASMNKRIKALDESGFIKKQGIRKTKAGFEAVIYELTARGYLALLFGLINFDCLLSQLDDGTALAIWAIIQSAVKLKP